MPVMNITNATIDNITSERGTTFVTITYTARQGNQRNEQTIRLVVRPRTIILNANGADDITVGNILDVDRNGRSFTTISDRDFSTIIRFNVPESAMIFDRMGRTMNFSKLTPGMRVRVRHANFMTASIPPQTTAFEVRVL